MKVYIDLLFLINFFCDFLVLLSVSIILKRNSKLKKIILASLFGSISTFVIFININSLQLFLLKVFLSSLIIIIAFNFKDIKYFLNNLLYFFINSLIMGGFMYFINLKFENNFLNNELLYNYIILVIFSPIIIYIYIRACLKIKYKYSLVYKINVYVKKEVYKLNGYYDTGNALVDPYKKRTIMIANKNKFKNLKLNYLLVPVSTISGNYLLKCFKPDRIYIKDIGNISNALIGLSEENIKIEGVDCLINKKILEERI